MAFIYNNGGTLLNGQTNTNNGFRHFGHGKLLSTTNAFNNLITFNWSTGAPTRIKFSVFGQFTAARTARSGYLVTFNMNFDLDSNGNVVWSQTGFISENGSTDAYIDINWETGQQLKFRTYVYGATYCNFALHAACNRWNYLSSVTYH